VTRSRASTPTTSTLEASSVVADREQDGERDAERSVGPVRLPAVDKEEPLGGGGTHAGRIVRIGHTVRRPRTASAELVEAFLVHLEEVGFDSAPRFRGVDELGRQILTYVDGEATVEPRWLFDEAANRSHLVAVASTKRERTSFLQQGRPRCAPAQLRERPGSTATSTMGTSCSAVTNPHACSIGTSRCQATDSTTW